MLASPVMASSAAAVPTACEGGGFTTAEAEGSSSLAPRSMGGEQGKARKERAGEDDTTMQLSAKRAKRAGASSPVSDCGGEAGFPSAGGSTCSGGEEGQVGNDRGARDGDDAAMQLPAKRAKRALRCSATSTNATSSTSGSSSSSPVDDQECVLSRRRTAASATGVGTTGGSFDGSRENGPRPSPGDSVSAKFDCGDGADTWMAGIVLRPAASDDIAASASGASSGSASSGSAIDDWWVVALQNGRVCRVMLGTSQGERNKWMLADGPRQFVGRQVSMPATGAATKPSSKDTVVRGKIHSWRIDGDTPLLLVEYHCSDNRCVDDQWLTVPPQCATGSVGGNARALGLSCSTAICAATQPCFSCYCTPSF